MTVPKPPLLEFVVKPPKEVKVRVTPAQQAPEKRKVLSAYEGRNQTINKALLSNRGTNREAFGASERARGRFEAQALEDHEPVAPHEPTSAEKLLTNLNLQFLDMDDVGSRQNILQAIGDTEQ
jgi:hypothetical protein